MHHIIRQYLSSFQAPYLHNKFLLENSRSLGSLPQNINYNGLLYTFVPELQMFVNQFGHAIDISQAAAFSEMADLDSFADIDDTAADPGIRRLTTAERSAILAFAWSWPYAWISSGVNWTKSNDSINFLAYSEDFDQQTSAPFTNIWSRNASISAVTSANITPPVIAPAGTTIWGIRTVNTPGNYAALVQTQYNLEPGTTYTFSYWTNVVQGATTNSIRILDRTGVGEPSFSDIVPLTAINYGSLTADANGWARVTRTFNTSRAGNTYVTGIDVSILARNIPAGGGETFYFWGAQLEKGSTATTYRRTYGIKDIRGGSWGNTTGSAGTYRVYENNPTLWLNYSSTNGVTYVSPLVSILGGGGSNNLLDMYPGWTMTNEMQTNYYLLNNLASGYKAIQPYILNAGQALSFDNDGMTATGAASRSFYSAPPYYPFTTTSRTNKYPSPWSDSGIDANTQVFNDLLNSFSANGISNIDLIAHDMETRPVYSFSIIGVTGATNGMLADSRYNQSWRGLSSWFASMAAEGATIANISQTGFGNGGYCAANTSYLVWNKIDRDYVVKFVDLSMVQPALQRYPNAIVSNYNNFVSDGGVTAAPPDYNGHLLYFKSSAGNAQAPELYGLIGLLATDVNRVRNDDPTRTQIWTSSTGITGATLERGAWTSLTQTLQLLRSIKRSSPNSTITPWFPDVKYYGDNRTEYGVTGNGLAPAVAWADVVQGFDSVAGLTFGKAGNSAYYYEALRHIGVHGVKHILYFDAYLFLDYGRNATTKAEYLARGLTSYQQPLSLFNNTLKEINENLGGYTIETADTSRISWLSDYITSGAPKADGSYLWRTTIKPGTIFEYPDSALNPSKVLSGSCVGTWITTNTSTAPVVQPQTLKDTFYVIGPSSTDNGVTAQGNLTPYAKWLSYNKEVVTTFQGLPYTGNQTGVTLSRGRAYEFEFDPINPQVSSPWHNVFYELCIDAYNWGARSFYLSYPLGQIPYLAYPFKDVVNRRKGVYTSTTDAAYCPARWKGWTSAIKGLLEGTLNPVGACAAKAGLGLTAISEGCNVMMYFQGTNGYWENRFGNTGAGPNGLTFYEGSLKLWDDCFAIAGTTQGANDLYYSYIDQFVDEIISIKSNLGTAGSLSCTFDATVDSATPGTVGLFEQLPSYYTRGNSYELTDWYIQERLRAAGIQCYVEARTNTLFSLINMGITGAGWDSDAPNGDPSQLRGIDVGTIRFNNKNLLMNSENFSYPASWQRFLNARVSGPTFGPSPTGTTNANLVTFTQNYSRVIQVPTAGQRSALSVGNTCTYSMWIKRVSGNTGLILYHFNGGANETPITVNDNWTRYSTSFAPTNTAIEVGIADKNSSGFGSVLVWGAQLETGSTVTSYQSTTGKADWKNWLAVEYNTWYQNPRNPVLGSTQDGYYAAYLTDSETPTCFRWTQNTGPLPPSRDPYQVPNTIVTGGTSYTLPYGFATWLDSPLKYLTDLYAASDVYRKFNNLANTGLTFVGVAYDQPTKGYVMNYPDFARGSCGNLQVSATNNFNSLTGYYRASTEQNQEGNAIGYSSPFTKVFNATAFAANPAAYASNGASGFWQLSGMTFWRTNVKQPTFDAFLNMLNQVSSTGAPLYGNTSGWAGATYPYDFYSRGIMPLNYRN